MKTADLDALRRIPILEVADALGMRVIRQGTAWALQEDDGRGVTSLTIFPGSNRWKRWSGITRGGVCSGSTIDLVMHHHDVSDVKEAIDWLSMRFPQ